MTDEREEKDKFPAWSIYLTTASILVENVSDATRQNIAVKRRQVRKKLKYIDRD